MPDPRAAQAALLAAGFVEAGDPELYARAPHELPLAWPGLPLEVEVHARPNWPPWLEAPPAAELLEGAVPSAAGVEGVLAPVPEKHLLVVAAHAWTHGPLQRLRDLLDVALLAAEADRAETGRLAQAWGLGRLWRTTAAVADALFLGEPTPRALRGWAKNLAEARERTVLEQHTARWRCWWDALPPGLAARATFDEVREDVTPEPGRDLGREAGPLPPRRPQRVRAPLRARPRSQVTDCYLKRASSSWVPRPGRWADVAPGELDPGVRVLVGGCLREPDDELRVVALLAQQAVEDERADEAARLARAEAEAPVDGA